MTEPESSPSGRGSATRLAVGITAAAAATVVTVGLTTSLLGAVSPGESQLVLAGGRPLAGAAPVPNGSVERGDDLKPGGTASPQNAFSAWAVQMAASTGVPARALEAYAVAERSMAGEQPGCHLGWPTLAGIGYVESANGGVGKGLLPSGRPFVPIFGVALDGVGPVAEVADSDDGRIDGDASGDRAVGPMQFLPSTWTTWQADGDGDGVKDPQDIDDAALAAARYLCVAGDLGTGEGWTAAVLSYNHSEEYLRNVYSAASTIAARSVSSAR